MSQGRANSSVPTDAQNVVSCLFQCSTSDAKYLCIHDLLTKLKDNDSHYDIGGTYRSPEEPELWFYFTTTTCPGYSYLLNLFVTHRRTGAFTLGVSNRKLIPSDQLSTHQPEESTDLTIFNFKSAVPEEHYYVKSICLTEKEVANMLELNTLPNALDAFLIPISIQTNLGHSVNTDLVRSIKLTHDISDKLWNQAETDFVLISSSGKHFKVHKIMLAAHSEVLRNALKNSTSTSMTLDNINDDDMELLLQTIYTGIIKDIAKKDCKKLLEIAYTFKLESLVLLIETVIGDLIHVDNAIAIATIAEEYNLGAVQVKVFEFIKKHPEVWSSEGWLKMNNSNLMKKLCEYMSKG